MLPVQCRVIASGVAGDGGGTLHVGKMLRAVAVDNGASSLACVPLFGKATGGILLIRRIGCVGVGVGVVGTRFEKIVILVGILLRMGARGGGRLVPLLVLLLGGIRLLVVGRVMM